MIPPLIALAGVPWDVLPPGVHEASLGEVRATFATNSRRSDLFDGLVGALVRLRHAGCRTAYIDGSYVTGKPHPNDFDVCWDPTGVDPAMLDRVFLDFSHDRAAQKAAFKGEFFPSAMMCADVGQTFLNFFQLERFTGKPKGIVSISLLADPFLLQKVQP